MYLETIKTWIDKNKMSSLFIGIIIMLSVVVIFQNNDQSKKVRDKTSLSHFAQMDVKETKASLIPVDQQSKLTNDKQQVITEVKVDIKGAVKFSGVYPAKSNQVVNDIVNLAIPHKNADLDAVNLAAPIKDAMVVYIPFKGEVKQDKFSMYQQAGTHNSNAQNDKKVININTSEQSALEEIPGIGPKKAQEIIQYRETNGGFKSIEEIKEIKGIGDKTFENLKDYISI
ncbi:helix-hairpin-helix domain-containing protein [Macrococcoides bohemicum]|uniref:helix-hairpin-helix domain-containing protein n=1 Tax=Macrococcoides bohemicum TaxID=1903056 RepID=UPI0028AE2ADB|nr:helix-hairpin-helix domain-containing protein [Macrococcus bohemicus]